MARQVLSPQAGEVVVFTDFFKRGFSLPPSSFLRGFLHYYGLELHHLNPNGVLQTCQFCDNLRSFSRNPATFRAVETAISSEAVSLLPRLRRSRHPTAPRSRLKISGDLRSRHPWVMAFQLVLRCQPQRRATQVLQLRPRLQQCPLVCSSRGMGSESH